MMMLRYHSVIVHECETSHTKATMYLHIFAAEHACISLLMSLYRWTYNVTGSQNSGNSKVAPKVQRLSYDA